MTVGRVLAALVGAVIAFAGANKATSPAQWRAAARAQHLPGPLAMVVPPVELVLGSCLVVLPANSLVMGAATLLLVVFTVFLGVQVAAGSTVPCACFGARAVRPPRWTDVLRNVLMIAALVVAAATA